LKKYDFDQPIDRHASCCIKTDFVPCREVLPMWVADMDFPVADEIVEALILRSRHPIFGYSYLPDGLFQAFVAWHERRHGIAYDPARIIPYYSVVSAIRLVLSALTEPDAAVTIMTPVYMQFRPSIEAVGRTVIENPLIENKGIYEIDFADLDRCLARSAVLLLCSPHNPVCRVWTREELGRIAVMCERHGVILLADEIHSDLIMPGYQNIPFMSLGNKVSSFSVTLLSATKTFNLAQTGMAFIITGNREYEIKIRRLMDSLHLGAQNVFAAVAVQAAYEHGADWLDQVLAYVHQNERLVRERMAKTTPKIVLSPLEGTYLLWLDCRALGVAMTTFFEKEAKIYGDDGGLFGPGGEGHYRLNIAASRPVVIEMLDRLEKAYQIHQS